MPPSRFPPGGHPSRGRRYMPRRSQAPASDQCRPSPGEPEQHRLRLIVKRVAEQDHRFGVRLLCTRCLLRAAALLLRAGRLLRARCLLPGRARLGSVDLRARDTWRIAPPPGPATRPGTATSTATRRRGSAQAVKTATTSAARSRRARLQAMVHRHPATAQPQPRSPKPARRPAPANPRHPSRRRAPRRPAQVHRQARTALRISATAGPGPIAASDPAQPGPATPPGG